MRLDIYLSEELDISRNKAQSLIKNWLVEINWKIERKCWYEIKKDEIIKILDVSSINYVSRSAKKLKDFLMHIWLDINNYTCLDIWASTWWFTQVMLENWAKKIYAVDVWTSQLHETLIQNDKVVSIENTDIRDFECIESFNLITVDVSFISLNIIIQKIYSLSNKQTNIILLFKPQFEVWKENLTKKWTPKKLKIVNKRLNEFTNQLKKIWFNIITVSKSTLPWEAWNNEYLIYCKKS